MKTTRITHKFVDAIPTDIAEGTLYVSITYATAIHLCCCGCGHEVVTPLTPTDWSVSFDGETVSLSPSIGNWSFECESHYWISHDRVRWAGKWSRTEIELGRARDRSAKGIPAYQSPSNAAHTNANARREQRGFRRLRELLRRR